MTNDEKNQALRALPSIDEVLAYPIAAWMAERLPRERVVDFARAAVDDVRAAVLAGKTCQVDQAVVETALVAAMKRLETPSLRRVVNATGVVLHTNLGRSPLAKEAIDAVVQAASGYSTLEYSVDDLARGSRHAHCEKLICELTGAEAAVAVNNNAAAVMLVLNEFAAGHAAIVSRGELVEIGGSFRIPDIMAASNAKMVEVGATNKTHLYDYERALADDVSMVLKVHPSNFRTIGFTEAVSINELRHLADAENAKRADRGGVEGGNVLVYEDQGSGSLVRMECFGEHAEPTVADSVKQGVDLVSFSGDKLLGGPQAGIVVGRKELIDRLKKNPLVRALRLDKMTLAALEATLRLYVAGDEAFDKVPILRMLNEPAEQVLVRADQLREAAAEAIDSANIVFDIVPEEAYAGGGSMPDCPISTYVVRATFAQGEALECERFLAQQHAVPIICRCKKEALLFDARTLLEGDIPEIVSALAAYVASLK